MSRGMFTNKLIIAKYLIKTLFMVSVHSMLFSCVHVHN